jgi:hypothetical protein
MPGVRPSILRGHNMTEKERIDIILKEYDTLRKELADRLDVPKLYVTPLLIVSLAGFFGWKSNIPTDLALMFAVAILLTFLSFAVHSWHALHSLSAQIAIVEDKVFQISNEPLLTHETKMVHERKKRPLFRIFMIGWAISCTAYIAIEGFLYRELSAVPELGIPASPVHLLILILFLSLPFVLFAYLGGRLVVFHRNLRRFDSGLLDWIKERGSEYLKEQTDTAEALTEPVNEKKRAKEVSSSAAFEPSLTTPCTRPAPARPPPATFRRPTARSPGRKRAGG